MYYIFTQNKAYFMYKLMYIDGDEVHLQKYYINSQLRLGGERVIYGVDFFLRNMEIYTPEESAS